MIIAWILVAAAVAWVWQASGWQVGLGALAAAFVANGVGHSALPPRTGSPVYLRSAYRTLVNRSADYARDNDQVRSAVAAKAAEHLAAACPALVDGA